MGAIKEELNEAIEAELWDDKSLDLFMEGGNWEGLVKKHRAKKAAEKAEFKRVQANTAKAEAKMREESDTLWVWGVSVVWLMFIGIVVIGITS